MNLPYPLKPVKYNWRDVSVCKPTETSLEIQHILIFLAEVVIVYFF